MGELVWNNRSDGPGAPATVLRHLAHVIAVSQGISVGLTPSTGGTDPDVVVKDNGTLSINLGTLFIDRPED
jgi:hypothetical protein